MQVAEVILNRERVGIKVDRRLVHGLHCTRKQGRVPLLRFKGSECNGDLTTTKQQTLAGPLAALPVVIHWGSIDIGETVTWREVVPNTRKRVTDVATLSNRGQTTATKLAIHSHAQRIR